MVSPPLTILCLVALLPIPLTICTDPIVYAVEAQAEFKINDGVGPGGECSLPGSFQMRADGPWIPSAEFDLTGNFDEDCGIYLHLSIPENEGMGVEEGKRKALMKEIDALNSKELNLKNEKSEHEEKMKKLEEEKEALNKKKEEIAAIRSELDIQEAKKKDVDAKKMDVEEMKKTLGEYSDEDFLKEAEKKLLDADSRVEKEIKRLEKLLRLYEDNECDPLRDADFMIIKNEVEHHMQDIMVCDPQ